MEIETKITKQSDMENHDGLSGYDHYIAAQQNHGAFRAFYDFLNEVKPTRILEIGTALGGFTQFLRLVSLDINWPFFIRSYDIHEMTWYGEIKNLGIDVRVENIFNEDYSIVDPEVISFIQGSGTTLVLCDGGDKVKEFNLLSNYIKQGDYIMAHDYVDTHENFEANYNGKIWNWHEISDENIKDACERNNLVTYNKEIFDKVVWVCRKKI
jgi:hypothetical protein